jgi:TonB family protein
MSKYERLGGYLLFEKIDEDKLSRDFLAGQVINQKIQQICYFKKFDHSLSTFPDFVMNLKEEFENSKTLANPGITRPNALFQEKSELGAVFEYVEGKSLRSILAKCSQDGIPFTVDHALLVGSRVCGALEYLHSRKINDQKIIHGMVSPEVVFVTDDGQIKIQFLGLAQALLKFPAGREKFLGNFKEYLAPEIQEQHRLDKAADVYGAGLVLFEMLTGESLHLRLQGSSLAAVLDASQMNAVSGEKIPLPAEIKQVLMQALATNPSQRYASVGDMRKALDLLLFSSEFSPTTFNLAFFLNTLFRDTIEQDAKNLTEYKKADVSSFMREQPVVPAPPAPKQEYPVGASTAVDMLAAPVIAERPQATLTSMERMGSGESAEKSKAPLFIGILIAVAVLGAIAFFAMRPSETKVSTAQPPSAVPALTQQQLQAQAMERERLENEAQKAQDEAKKKDEQLQALQAKLDALVKSQQEQEKKAAAAGASAQAAVDPVAIKKLQEEAKKLEEEKKEKEALAQQKLKEAQTPPATTAAPQQVDPSATGEVKEMASAATPTSDAAVPPVSNPEQGEQLSETPAPAEPAVVNEGDLVPLTPDVVRPEIKSRANPTYPRMAAAKKVEGTVILRILVSETGDAADVQVLRPAGGSMGLNEAAVAAAKEWKFQPAVKDGKRVKVWMTYPIVFKLQ